jgi:hypothetical protein
MGQSSCWISLVRMPKVAIKLNKEAGALVEEVWRSLPADRVRGFLSHLDEGESVVESVGSAALG